MLIRLNVTALLTLVPAFATVYYIDAANGSDDQDGASPASAWQSLARVATASLAPGDSVLLRRGQVWQEPLVITSSSGNPDAPIVFGAFGAGSRPAIDGRNLSRTTDLISISSRYDIVVAGIELRNSQRHGINVFNSARIVFRDLLVTGSRRNGILTYNSNGITIDGVEVSYNGQDTSAAYDGVRLDGTGTFQDFTVRNCTIHDNTGGEGWNSANGLFIGHTDVNIPTMRNVRVTGSEFYANGNPSQNQAGRGLTGVFHGDVTVTGNYIHENASAGLYLGDRGVNLNIVITNNTFYNNSLRQFGGFTSTWARALKNTVLVDDPNITAMGAEIGGDGNWELTNNTFYYKTPSADSYRAFIRINDATTTLQSDWNLFYAAGIPRWRLSDGTFVDFRRWQALGFDKNGKSPQ